MQKETVRIPMNSSLLDLLQSLLSMIMLAAGDIRHGQFLLPLTAWTGEDAGTTFIERHIA